MLAEDIRLVEGLKACMNCGVCTAVCPAAEFYNYDPRQIVAIVQTRDDEEIERLLKSDVIWYCGECMSCRPRCPRGNTPGYVIQALRTLSQRLGFFVESEKGRQQLALKRMIGDNILATGYCLTPRNILPELHPEQGPVWEWIYSNDEAVFGRYSECYGKEGAGALRKVDGEDGVFVKVGLLLRYKKVNVLFNDGDHAIIEYKEVDETGIRVHDQVVYKGSKLYDGKAVS